MKACDTITDNPHCNAACPAGILGVLQAATWLGHANQSPLLHLRTLNPHVQTAVHSSTGLVLPRQQGPVGTLDEPQVIGVSGFAFQVRYALTSSCSQICSKQGHLHQDMCIISSY